MNVMMWLPGLGHAFVSLDNLLNEGTDHVTATMGDPDVSPPDTTMVVFSVPVTVTLIPGTTLRVAESVLSLGGMTGPYTVHLQPRETANEGYLMFAARPSLADLPPSPLSELEQMSAHLHEMYTAFVGAGFTEGQALTLIMHGHH